jgi:hypothetical protein
MKDTLYSKCRDLEGKFSFFYHLRKVCPLSRSVVAWDTNATQLGVCPVVLHTPACPGLRAGLMELLTHSRFEEHCGH